MVITGRAGIEEIPEETKMITGDENIVLADLVVQWKITEPTKFLFNSEDPEELLHDATSASLRSIIGSSKIDDALTSGKAEIEAEVTGIIINLLKNMILVFPLWRLSCRMWNFQMTRSEKAFTNVTDARETMNTKINEARKYENKRLNEAEGEKEAIIFNAQGDKAAG